MNQVKVQAFSAFKKLAFYVALVSAFAGSADELVTSRTTKILVSWILSASASIQILSIDLVLVRFLQHSHCSHSSSYSSSDSSTLDKYTAHRKSSIKWNS